MNTKVVKMRDIKFDESLFIPMQTGKVVDNLLSGNGGLMKGCNFAFVGDPGVGKSTVLLDILADLQKNGSNVLFVSGEMNRLDLYGYVQRFPKFKNLPILFLGEYLDNDPVKLLESEFNKGYDVILLDSMAEICVMISDYHRCTNKQAETIVLNLLEKHNLANNDNKTNTTFLIIQQVTKTGNFAGSNRFKHQLSGMAHMIFETDDQRKIFFSKNRRGGRMRSLYFDLGPGGSVQWIHPDSVQTEA